MQHSIFIANAEAGAAQGDLLGSLGVDWKLLVIQLLSFLILLAVLKKLVFPTLFAAIDKREKSIEESVKAAEQAKIAAEKAEAGTEKQLEQAKKDAASIVQTAQNEAAAIAGDAEAKAHKKVEHILEQAQARIDSDIASAKKDLHAEMVSLVASATEKVIGAKIDAKTDAALIKKALEEAN